jgi:hypothetical protein
MTPITKAYQSEATLAVAIRERRARRRARDAHADRRAISSVAETK